MNRKEVYFEEAIDLIGRDWLEKQESQYYDDTVDQNHLTGDSPPEVVRQYHIAKEDLENNEEKIFQFRDLREDTVEFLWLGQVYESVKDAPIIDPGGEIDPENTVKDIYQSDIRIDKVFRNVRFELETGAEYVWQGHDPAFVNENKTATKTPDLELLDLDDQVQIECKRCDISSDQDERTSNLIDELFQKTKECIGSQRYIALFEFSRLPAVDEIESLGRYFSSPITVGQFGMSQIDLPFGTLYLLPFLDHGIIRQPTGHLEGFEIVSNFYDLYVRPALETKLDVEKDAEELGNWQLFAEANRRGATLFYRNPIWIGIREDTSSSTTMDRFRNQFKGVSGKFQDCPSILHIDFPEYREGDALQELRFRRKAGGELKQRPEISAVTVSGLKLMCSDDSADIYRNKIVIPNYNPHFTLPKELNLIEPSFDDTIAHDNIVTDADEELMSDPNGVQKALDQAEGTFSFRFTPEEPMNVDTPKKILSLESKSGEASMDLEVTDDSTLMLTRIKSDTKWTCEIDGSEIPDYTPLHFFLIWEDNKTKLLVSPSTWDDELTAVCDNPK